MTDRLNVDQGPLIPRNRAIHPDPYNPGYKTSVARSPNLPLLSMESTPSVALPFNLRRDAFGDNFCP